MTYSAIMKQFAIACCGFVAITSGFADTHKIPPEEPFATIRINDKWKVKPQGDAIEADSPDGSVVFLVASVERNKVAEAVGEAMRYLRNRGGGIAVKSESRHDETGKVNGNNAHFISWQAKKQNEGLEMKFAVVMLAPNASLIAAYDGSPAAIKKWKRDLDKMLESISRIESKNGGEGEANRAR